MDVLVGVVVGSVLELLFLYINKVKMGPPS